MTDTLRLSEAKVLAALQVSGDTGRRADDIAATTGLNVHTVRKALGYLRCSGAVVCRTTRRYHWAITDNGRARITGAAYAEYITAYSKEVDT